MQPIDMVALRERHGWTQRQFGDAIGRTGRTICLYEAGVEKIPLVVALACAAVQVGIRKADTEPTTARVIIPEGLRA